MKRSHSFTNLEPILPFDGSASSIIVNAQQGRQEDLLQSVLESRSRLYSTACSRFSSTSSRSFDGDLDFLSNPGISLIPETSTINNGSDEDDGEIMANSRKLSGRQGHRRCSTPRSSSTSSTNSEDRSIRERTVVVLEGDAGSSKETSDRRSSPGYYARGDGNPLEPYNFAAMLVTNQRDSVLSAVPLFNEANEDEAAYQILNNHRSSSQSQLDGHDNDNGNGDGDGDGDDYEHVYQELSAINEEDEECRRLRTQSCTSTQSGTFAIPSSDGAFVVENNRSSPQFPPRRTSSEIHNDEFGVVLRLNEQRAMSSSPRCQSQIIESPFLDRGDKGLSCSTPSVHSLSDTVQINPLSADEDGVERDQHQNDVITLASEAEAIIEAPFKKKHHTWIQHFPAAYGRHQIIPPKNHLPSRSTSSADATSRPQEVKIRPEKESSKKRERGILSMLSMRGSSKAKHEEKEKHRNSSTTSLPPSLADIAAKRSNSTNWPSGGTTIDGLPDVLARALNDELRNGNASIVGPGVLELPAHYHPQLTKAKWEDLDLWSVEDPAWSVKYGSSTRLNKSEKKKQDIIHDIYITEKHHCQVIVILQQVYQAGLRAESILGESELNELIPSVLDGLLDFHLKIFRRLRAKKLLSPIVDTISDVIHSEFEISPSSRAAIDAYISFCDMKDSACRVFERHFAEDVKFRHFIERFETDAFYKKHSFKSCLLLITQRLTKYPVMLDLLMKQESAELRDETSRAAMAVKTFAMRVDNGLSRLQIHRRWDYIQKHFNRQSRGTLHGIPFTYEDLTSFESQRKVLCIGTVLWQNAARKPEKTLMVLFDDIIAFFVDKSGQYFFYSQDKHDSVIALKKMLVRDKERENSMLLIVTEQKPDMYEIMFTNKSEMKQWRRALDNAQVNAVPVRRVVQMDIDGALQLANQLPTGSESEERIYESRFDAWQKALDELFARRSRAEGFLEEYMDNRLRWFDEVRRHMKLIPVRGRHDVPDRIKSLVKEKFAELKATRRSALDRFLETAQSSRDDDLPSIYDDIYDATGQPTSGSSDQSDESGEDGNKKTPRRIRTFHGTDDYKQSMDGYINDEDVYSEGSFRRHTTVPKINTDSMDPDEENEAEQDAERHQLPIGMSSRCRRAATRLIKENVQARTENSRLKADVALLELHVASLKTRRATATSSPTDTLEALRKKQQEVQEEERQLRAEHERREIELRMMAEELDKKQRILAANESELEGKWNAYYQRLDDVSQQNNRASPASSTANDLRLLSQQNNANNFRQGSVINSSSIPSGSPQRGNGQMNNFSLGGKSGSNSELPKHLADKTEKKKTKRN